MVQPKPPRPPLTTGVVVAVILSLGICTAINLLVFAVFWDAVYSSTSGISENATQILTGWGGGIIGVIGALVGYKAGSDERTSAESIATQAATAVAEQAAEEHAVGEDGGGGPRPAG